MISLNRNMSIDVGCGCFGLYRDFPSLVRLIPLRDFYECCQLAARLRKCVKNVRNIFLGKLKLPSSQSQSDAIVDFMLLAFGKIVPQPRIECAVLVIRSPLKHGLETTT